MALTGRRFRELCPDVCALQGWTEEEDAFYLDEPNEYGCQYYAVDVDSMTEEDAAELNNFVKSNGRLPNWGFGPSEIEANWWTYY